MKMGLLQQEVAVKIDICAPMLSKIEKGVRYIKRDKVSKLSIVINIDREQLLTIWLAEQVLKVIKNEPAASEVIKADN
jgi:hypothetical protein